MEANRLAGPFWAAAGRTQALPAASDIEAFLLSPYKEFNVLPNTHVQMSMAQLMNASVLRLREELGNSWPNSICVCDASVEERTGMLHLQLHAPALAALLRSPGHWALLAWRRGDSTAVVYDGLRNTCVADQATAFLAKMFDSY